MGVESRRYTVLSCDRCGATLGEDAVYAGTVAARFAAAELGWRLVPKRLPDGTEVAVPPLTRPNIRFVNDVCPDCAAKFTRRRAKITWSKEARGAEHAAG